MKQMNLVNHLLKRETKSAKKWVVTNSQFTSDGKRTMHYYTYKNKPYNANNVYNTVPPNYINNRDGVNNMDNGYNETRTMLNHPYFKCDPHTNMSNNQFPNNTNVNTIAATNPNKSNYYSPDKYNSQSPPPLNNMSHMISYQYFSIFGSTSMCLIKPIFPDQILNKNKLTILGKGGFQFMFMKRQSNTNKYDKNNKMSIFVKINHLSSILFLTDAEHLKNPLNIKGPNGNYLIIDKHKEKKDHLIIKYKYQPPHNTNTPTNNNTNHHNDSTAATANDMENNKSSIPISDDTNNTTNLTINLNDNINDLIEEPQNIAYQELHVSVPFSEFLIFQKAANMLLPHLLGWARQL